MPNVPADHNAGRDSRSHRNNHSPASNQHQHKESTNWIEGFEQLNSALANDTSPVPSELEIMDEDNMQPVLG